MCLQLKYYSFNLTVKQTASWMDVYCSSFRSTESQSEHMLTHVDKNVTRVHMTYRKKAVPRTCTILLQDKIKQTIIQLLTCNATNQSEKTENLRYLQTTVFKAL